MSADVYRHVVWTHKDPVMRALLAVDEIIANSDLAADDVQAITNFISNKYRKETT